MVDNKSKELGKTIKQQRVLVPLTLQELAVKSGVSASHLGRIERGERFPSARILRKIAKPLGLGEEELFTLANYLSPKSPGEVEKSKEETIGRLDPYVARVLARETPETQRTVIVVLTILKNLAKTLTRKEGIMNDEERMKKLREMSERERIPLEDLAQKVRLGELTLKFWKDSGEERLPEEVLRPDLARLIREFQKATA